MLAIYSGFRPKLRPVKSLQIAAMVQYAESIVKLDENAVFWLMCPQEQQEEQQSKT
jgi:hypothetical protein